MSSGRRAHGTAPREAHLCYLLCGDTRGLSLAAADEVCDVATRFCSRSWAFSPCSAVPWPGASIPAADPSPRMTAPGQPARRYVTVDSDADGTVDVVLRAGSVESFARPRADDPEARWLVLCVDGVPYAEMLMLWKEGYFREFFRPVPLIAPFPTASGIALSEAFHTAPVQGYEDGYFDIQRNRLSGGALMTTTGENIPYLKLLDYDMPGALKGLAYILPHKSYRADLGRFRSRFLASHDKIYLAHIASTDSLYHI